MQSMVQSIERFLVALCDRNAISSLEALVELIYSGLTFRVFNTMLHFIPVFTFLELSLLTLDRTAQCMSLTVDFVCRCGELPGRSLVALCDTKAILFLGTLVELLCSIAISIASALMHISRRFFLGHLICIFVACWELQRSSGDSLLESSVLTSAVFTRRSMFSRLS